MALRSSHSGASGGPLFDLADASSGHTTGLLVLSNLQRGQPPAAKQLHAVGHTGSAQWAALGSSLPAAAAPPPPPLRQQQQQQRRPQHLPQQQQQHAAARLNSQLQSIELPPASLRDTVLGLEEAAAAGGGPEAAASAAAGAAAPPNQASFARRVSGLALRVGDLLQPQGEVADCDSTWGARVVNVLTSLPFVAVGYHMHRQRLTPEGRHHAASMIAVGAAATLYHASSGRARRLARKVDYWTIAYSSSAMIKSLYADNPAARRAASLSLLAVPFRPFAVSMGHALVMQAEFARQATQHKAVRRDLRRHYTAAALGVTAFFSEDLLANTPYNGFVHAAWHCLACYGVATMNGLMSHNERQRLQRRLGGAAGGGGGQAGVGGKPLRRVAVHSSASSLPSYAGSCARLAGGSPLGGASPTYGALPTFAPSP